MTFSRNYASELFAFRHRINGDDRENENFIKALTNPTFFSRKDVADDASYAQPALEREIDSSENNLNLAQEGLVMTSIYYLYLTFRSRNAQKCY